MLPQNMVTQRLRTQQQNNCLYLLVTSSPHRPSTPADLPLKRGIRTQLVLQLCSLDPRLQKALMEEDRDLNTRPCEDSPSPGLPGLELRHQTWKIFFKWVIWQLTVTGVEQSKRKERLLLQLKPNWRKWWGNSSIRCQPWTLFSKAQRTDWNWSHSGPYFALLCLTWFRSCVICFLRTVN